MEEGSVKEESYTVQITPGNMTVIVDVYDNNDPNSMPIISEWGYTREHAIRRTLATVLRDQGFLLMAEDDRHGHV